MAANSVDQHNRQLSRRYRKARDLFLTQQFTQAFEETTLLLKPHDAFEDIVETGKEDTIVGAPVSFAKRSLRVKVWSLYLTLLSTFRGAGTQKASAWIGAQTWESLDTSLRSGSIWQRVVEVGYAGDELALDHEVIVALVTLCLSETSSRRVAQEKLEVLLGTEQPDRPETTNSDEFAKYNQLVELFLLHVLPKNEEWDYARAFVANNGHIDPDSRERYKEAVDFLEDSAHRIEVEKDNLSSLDLTETIRNDFTSRMLQSERSKFKDESSLTPEKRPQHTSDQLQRHESFTPQPNAVSSKGHEDRLTVPVQGSDSPNKVNEKIPVAKSTARQIKKTNINDRNILYTITVFKNLLLAGKEYVFKNPQMILRILLLYLFIQGLLANRQAHIILTRWLRKLKQTIIMGTKVSYA